MEGWKKVYDFYSSQAFFVYTEYQVNKDTSDTENSNIGCKSHLPNKELIKQRSDKPKGTEHYLTCIFKRKYANLKSPALFCYEPPFSL